MIVPHAESSCQPTFEELPDILTPEHLWRYLPIGRNAVYDLLKSKRIQNTRIGQKIIITKNALRSFLDSGEKS
jgi:hypothetical protein